MKKSILFLATLILLSSSYTVFSMKSNKEEANGSGVPSRVLGVRYHPSTLKHEDVVGFKVSRKIFLVHGDPENGRSECSFLATQSDGVESKWAMLVPLQKFEPEMTIYRQGKTWDLSRGLPLQDKEHISSIRTFCSPQTMSHSAIQFNIGPCLWDVYGDIKISASTLTFKSTYFFPQGKIVFRPQAPDSLLRKITIIPANNQKPTLIDGRVTFGDKSSVDLEIINVSKLIMKFK